MIEKKGIKPLIISVEASSLYLTDRSLDRYERYCQFDHRNLPSGIIILNVGSGFNQSFEGEQERKD